MGRLIWIFSFLLSVFFLGCAAAPDLKQTDKRNTGQVFFYLSTLGKASSDISFTLIGMGLLNKEDKWVDVTLDAINIRSSEIKDQQINLGEFRLPADDYKKISFTVKEAYVHRGDARSSLALPNAVHEQASQGSVIFDVPFTIHSYESQTIFIDWDADKSIKENYIFSPGMTARPQGLELKNALAYVSNEGSDCVTIIETVNDFVVGAIAVGQRPQCIIVSASGDKAYVANAGSKTVSVIDTLSNRVLNTIDNLGYAPSDLAISWDSRFLFATNPKSDTVSVIDLDALFVIQRINVGRNPTSIVADNDRRELYVANSGSFSVSIISMDTHRVVGALAVSISPRYMTLCDEQLYVGGETTDEIEVVNIPDLVTRKIRAGFKPGWLSCGFSGRIYAINKDDDSIAFFHSGMGIVLQGVRVGRSPSSLAVDSVRKKLYVTNKDSGDISIIDLISEKVEKTISVGSMPYGIAIFTQ
ncbi:MAG: beta-propeller fold lactonase family protein [Pseudomonadota bacterium]